MTGRWLMASIQMTFAIMPAAIYWFAGYELAHGTRRSRSARSSRSRPCRRGCSSRSAAAVGSASTSRPRWRCSTGSSSTSTCRSTSSSARTRDARRRARRRALRGRLVPLRRGAVDAARRSTRRSRRGRRTAVVGETGSGKTTLGYLVSRLYERSAGGVTIDGVDIRDLTLRLAGGDGRRRLAGDLPVPRLDPREPPLRQARRDRRGDRGGGAGRADPRADLLAPRGLRHDGRRARLPLLRRREAADRDRPRGPAQPADPRPRRGDLGARHRDRARRAGGARRARRGAARRSRSPTGSRRSATPTRSSCSTAGRSSSAAPTTSCVALGGRFAALLAARRADEDRPEASAGSPPHWREPADHRRQAPPTIVGRPRPRVVDSALCRRVDVQTHVVDHHRLTQLGQHLVHERLAQILGQLLHVRAEDDRRQELARVLGLLGRRLQPALGGGKPAASRRSRCRLRSGVVPRRLRQSRKCSA